MSKPSLAHLLISTATMGGITVLWLEFTREAIIKVAQLSKEIFADKGAEERKRRREIEQEVRREMAEEEEFYKRIEEEE